MVKVLITGGAGFIGSHMVDYCIAKGVEVIVIDHSKENIQAFLPNHVRVYNVDITSPSIKTIFNVEEPDYVVHLAAQKDVTTSQEDPKLDAYQNIIGTLQVLKCAKISRVKKIVFSSSSAVYGVTKDESITEDYMTNPISFYGLSKYVAEEYIKLFYKTYGLPYTILRYSNVYGPRQSTSGEGGVIAKFITAGLSSQACNNYGDGEQSRDFLYVSDVVRANYMALQQGDNQTVNIGTNQKVTINELQKHIARFTHNPNQAAYGPGRKGDIRHSRLNCDKAKAILDWEPKTTLLEGLRKTISYYS